MPIKSKKSWGGHRPNAGPRIRNLHLSINEALLVVDALNGILTEPPLAKQRLGAEVEEAIRLNRLDQKWQVDGADLVARLKKLDSDAAQDLLHRVEQFWSAPHVSDGEKRVQDVGLVAEGKDKNG